MVRVSLIFILIFLISCNQTKKNQRDIDLVDLNPIQLIPYPKSIQIDSSYFTISAATTAAYVKIFENEFIYLNGLLSRKLTKPFKVIGSDEIGAANLRLELIKHNNVTIKNINEYYELSIAENELVIAAYQPEGMMRGIQTLRQLFVEAFHAGEIKDEWHLPCLKIKDAPDFQHRGLLLDVCRHYFDQSVVFKYIDALAFYKMNVLHFHLTEDQGWRIPIEKYPRLTEIGGWRLDSNGNKYGGFYSKQELKEIVAYATERHITVIPEIEMPGHAQAALAAYPQFSCTGGPVEVVNDWGVFKEIYCAGNDSTFIFIEDVLTEVMEIFPSKYIHIGGDEAPKFRWEHCAKCQTRMKVEGLEDEHELQAYFIQRIEKFLNKNNRQLIGWDEILEGGLSENATVQSWRSIEGGKIAAESGHFAIMSPTSHCYLDYNLGAIDLEKIYGFNPIPEGLNQDANQYILGGECNIWTEHVPNDSALDAKVFPRMIGLAEALWTNERPRKFEHFYERLQKHYPILSHFGINYGPETIGASLNEVFKTDGTYIQLIKKLKDIELKYFWKGKSNKYIDYTELIPFKSGELHVQAFKNDKPYGKEIVQKYFEHLALNAAVKYNSSYHTTYQANKDRALTDGKRGSIDFRDGAWQGFWNQDVDLIIDLKEVKIIEYALLNFYQYSNAWIFLPQLVEVSISETKAQWKPFTVYENKAVDLSNQQKMDAIVCSSQMPPESSKGRYIKIHIEGLDKIPDGHEAAGQPTWIFLDEIIIN